MKLQIWKTRNFYNHSMLKWLVYWTLGILLIQQIKLINAIKFKGEKCLTKGTAGVCQEWSECPQIKTLIDNGDYTTMEVVNCGFSVREELICCPVLKKETAKNPRYVSLNSTLSVDDANDRPAVKACRRIESGLTASLANHIMGGTPVELGEFPHMVALAYKRVGGDGRTLYDIRCGGSLIDKRFVLTAAHCVTDRQNVPSLAILGMVNYTDPHEMNAAQKMKIKNTYIHDGYSLRQVYNDIAILELDSDVEYNEFTYPTCLYTNDKDPEPSVKLWVTGWGIVNITTRTFSDILLKAPVYTTPLENCNTSYIEYGYNGKISAGLKTTQLCAYDKAEIRDSCQADSGGPLSLILDESYKNFRLVAIVSTGFSCGSAIPGIYTKVAAFLDYIEKIVWPNGGD